MTEVKLGELAPRTGQRDDVKAVRPEDGEGSYGINDDLKVWPRKKA
jgi:hypothetical protein